MVGYIGNSFLPACAGEVVRSFIISDQSALSSTCILTTALTERLMDAIALILCGSVVPLQVSPKPAWRNAALDYIIVVQAIGLAMVLVLGLFALYRVRAARKALSTGPRKQPLVDGVEASES